MKDPHQRPAPRRAAIGRDCFQFTPTHASWLNQAEIFFSILQRRLLKHGAFTSGQDLTEQMLCFVETYNLAWTPPTLSPQAADF